MPLAAVSPSVPVPALPDPDAPLSQMCVCVCTRVCVSGAGTGLVRRIQKLKSPACGDAGCDCTRGNQPRHPTSDHRRDPKASTAPYRVTGTPEKCACKEQQHVKGSDACALADSGEGGTASAAQDTAQMSHASEVGADGNDQRDKHEKAEEQEEDEMRPYYINDWANFTASRERILDMAKLCAESFSLPPSDLENPFALYTQRS